MKSIINTKNKIKTTLITGLLSLGLFTSMMSNTAFASPVNYQEFTTEKTVTTSRATINKQKKDYVNLPTISSEHGQRFIVKEGKMELLEDLDDKNMGESETLSSFVEYATTKYRAHNNTLIFWSHGAGAVDGFGTDDKHDADGLNLEELNVALNNSLSKKGLILNNVIFDACLMGTYETAQMLSSHAKFMMASTETSPGEGFNYKPLITDLAAGKSLTSIEDERLRQYTNGIFDTLAITDLSKIDNISKALSALLPKLSDEEIKVAAEKAVFFGGETPYGYDEEGYEEDEEEGTSAENTSDDDDEFGETNVDGDSNTDDNYEDYEDYEFDEDEYSEGEGFEIQNADMYDIKTFAQQLLDKYPTEANASHELKTPIMAIQGYAEGLQYRF